MSMEALDYVLVISSMLIQAGSVILAIRLPIVGGFSRFWWTWFISISIAGGFMQRVMSLVRLFEGGQVSTYAEVSILLTSVVLFAGLYGMYRSLGLIVRMAAAAINAQAKMAAAMAGEADDLNHIREAKVSLDDALNRMKTIADRLRHVARTSLPPAQELRNAGSEV